MIGGDGIHGGKYETWEALIIRLFAAQDLTQVKTLGMRRDRNISASLRDAFVSRARSWLAFQSAEPGTRCECV